MKTQHNTTQHNTTQHNTTQHNRNLLIIMMLLAFLFSSCTDLKNEISTKNISAENRDFPTFCVPAADPSCTRYYGVIDSVKINSECYMLIKFDYDICPSGIKIFNETITFSKSGKCNTLEQYINYLFTIGQFANATSALNFLHSLVFKGIENKILNSLSPTDYSCNGPSPVNFSSQIITASCRRLCKEQNPDGGWYSVALISCGRGCCKKFTSFCYEGNVLQTLGSQITVSSNSCEDIEYCPSDALSGSCYLSCDRIDNLTAPSWLLPYLK